MGTKYGWGRRFSRRAVVRGGLAAGGVLGGGLIAGCGTSTTPAPAAAVATNPPATQVAAAPAATNTPAPPAAKYGGLLKSITTTVERNLDPHATNGGGGSMGASVCYSQLIKYKSGPDVPPPSYIPAPDLAESWTQPDELTVIFKLRQGVKWHTIAPLNGREFVADDIIYSYQRIRELKTHAARIAAVSKAEAVDKYTLKLTQDKPDADLLISLGDYNLKIVAKEAVAVNGNLEAPPVIGTGPWLFGSWSPTAGMVAKRNPDYFLKGLPYPDGLETYRAADSTTALNAFRSGNVNAIGAGITADIANEILKALPNTRVVWVTLDRTPSPLVLKPAVEPFTDIRVRQAISKAIDRKAIIELVFLSRGSANPGIVVPADDWMLPKAELDRLLARDVDGAKRLLTEAGKASGFDMEILTPNYLSNAYVTVAELIQANLRDVGIRVSIKVVDAATHSQQISTGAFQTYVGASSAASTNSQLYGTFYTKGPINYAGYASPELDKLIDQQAVMVKDPDGRKKVLMDIQRRVMDDAIIINLFNRQQPALTAPEIMDFYLQTEFIASPNAWTTAWINK